MVVAMKRRSWFCWNKIRSAQAMSVTTSCWVTTYTEATVVISWDDVLRKLEKRQNTVETSTFGSELVAMRIAKEMIVGLHCKLRMFGVPIDGPANVYCDNQGVVKNTSLPESTLSKKHNAINYHAVCEACAAGIMWVAKEPTETNLADLFTKPLIRLQQEFLLACIVWGSFAHEEWLTGRKWKRAADES